MDPLLREERQTEPKVPCTRNGIDRRYILVELPRKTMTLMMHWKRFGTIQPFHHSHIIIGQTSEGHARQDAAQPTPVPTPVPTSRERYP